MSVLTSQRHQARPQSVRTRDLPWLPGVRRGLMRRELERAAGFAPRSATSIVTGRVLHAGERATVSYERLSPGAQFPAHAAQDVEEFLLVSGEARSALLGDIEPMEWIVAPPRREPGHLQRQPARPSGSSVAMPATLATRINPARRTQPDE